MPVMDEIREQHEKVKQKGLKYRLQYFWDYYRTPTIVTILGVILAISLLHTFPGTFAQRFGRSRPAGI